MSFGDARVSAAGHGVRRVLRGSSDNKKPPPLMDPGRERDRGRILRLFKPYRWRLAAVMGLIVFSAGLGMLQPFLLRDTLDEGIFEHKTTLLTWLVLAMIAIAVATAVFSVWQTYISNSIGQRVMHDLRAAVYRHLQRMSLAFFTRTRTGEVQSRISNDIGGLDNVVTTTATTIAQNATTVIATVVAVTTLQTRLLFPIQQLLGVGADVEASLALFDRIFEYLDLPIDIVEARNPVRLRAEEVLGEVRFEAVWFSYGANGDGAD